MKQIAIPLNKEALFSGTVMALSAVIAFFLYHYLQLPEGYWAVISIAAVTQARVNNTIFKIFLRIIGTILGASSAYYFVNLLPQSFLIPVFLVACLSVCC